MEGLGDTSNLEDFDTKITKLSALDEYWKDCKLPYAGKAGLQFFDYFRCVQADVV